MPFVKAGTKNGNYFIQNTSSPISLLFKLITTKFFMAFLYFRSGRLPEDTVRSGISEKERT
jgi:hypothetical protein